MFLPWKSYSTMKFYKTIKKKNIALIIIIVIFIIYFSAIIYFSFTVETTVLFRTLTKNKLLLLSLFSLLMIMLFLVLINLIQIGIDRLKNREGARFKFRLTFFFLIVASIPLIPLSVVSNNWISKSINLLFVSGIAQSLKDAVEVSKELYNKLSEESKKEWEELCGDCPAGHIKDLQFQKIDGVFVINIEEKKINPLFSRYDELSPDFGSIVISDLNTETWRRVDFENSEYLLTPVKSSGKEAVILVREIPDALRMYTVSIAGGLQNYRTLKIMRKPMKVFVIVIFVLVTLPFVLLSFYLGLIVSKDVTVPIRELVIATRKVANDELDYKVNLKAKDELKLLIDSFNRMTEDLRINKELLKYSERSAAWQDIARKIAHEIKNPLTPIKLSAERMLRLYEGEDDFRDILSKGIYTIITEVNNITYMVNEFSRITRFPDSKLEKNDIIKIIEEIFSFVNNAYKNVEFSLRHKENVVYLFIDRYQVRRAILNIIYNSIDAVAENGKIWIDCYTNKGKKGYYTISISDNGAGIEDDIKGKIFNPYFSTKDRGAGLGLVIVEKIVFDNKGRIWFESTSGKTTFFMEFLKV